MDEKTYSITDINLLSPQGFVSVIGPVFERSPWISESIVALRPFSSVADLHRALCDCVLRSGEARQLDLIRAHPDLVGRAALQGKLTTESTKEQASAGLGQLTSEEVASFQKFNSAYRGKFGFPFVICARLNKRDAIIAGFEARLGNSISAEIKTALLEIFKIAHLRLQDLISE